MVSIMCDKKKSLVVCLTALNYVYAKLSGKLAEHDVLCVNEAVANWVQDHADPGLDKIKVANFRQTSLWSALRFLNCKECFELGLDHQYSCVFSSFSTGWHFVTLRKIVNIKNATLYVTDDGFGTLNELDTKYFYLRKLLSSILFLQPKGFTRKRNFHSSNTKSAITIYDKDLFEERLPADLEVINIKDKMIVYLNFLCRNRGYAKKDLGIYIQSDAGHYHHNPQWLFEKIILTINQLKETTKLCWLVKSKETDPFLHLYNDHGINREKSTINQELLLELGMQNYCCRYDTFLLNALILDIPGKFYVREFDPSKENWQAKKCLIDWLIKKNKKNDVVFLRDI
jgi:hypothetical protein